MQSITRETLYEARESAIHGTGIFASRSLPVGTCVMCVIPTVSVDQKGNTGNITPAEIYSAFRILTAARQVAWMRLTYASNADLDRLAEEVSKHERAYAYMVNANRQGIGKIVARFLNNSAVRINKRGGVTHDLLIQPFEASQINHSCLPNAWVVWSAGHWELRAIKDIPADEEITIAYASVLLGPESRAKELMAVSGIECCCKACDKSTNFGKDSANRRSRLEILSNMLNKLKTTSMHLSVCGEMLQLMQEEGIAGWDVGRTHACLGIAYTQQANHHRAVAEWTEVVKVADWCYGADHPFAKQQRDELQKAELCLLPEDAARMRVNEPNEANPSETNPSETSPGETNPSATWTSVNKPGPSHS